MNRQMRYAVFLELFFKWDGDLYREHFDAVYKEDTTPMIEAEIAAGGRKGKGRLFHEADEIAMKLRALKPRTVE